MYVNVSSFCMYVHVLNVLYVSVYICVYLQKQNFEIHTHTYNTYTY